MKKSHILASLGLALGVLLGAAPAGAGIVLSFSPASSHIGVGDTVQIDVTLSGLGSEVLSAYDLNFLWNGAVANFGSTHFPDHFGAGGSLTTDVNTQGNVGMIGYAALPDDDVAATQTGDLLIASFFMVGMTDGASQFTLGSDLVFERNFVGRNSLSLDVVVGSACIAVGNGSCHVPEPAGYGLVGLALLAAFAPAVLRRRREPGQAI